ALDRRVGLEQGVLALAEFAELTEARFERHQAAEKQLEQKLAAEAFRPRGNGQPDPQVFEPARCDGVHVAIGLAWLRVAPPDDQPVGGQPAQDRVDLAEALTPEVRDAAVDGLLDVVARAGPRAQHPEHGIAGGVAGRHISGRYTDVPPLSSGHRAGYSSAAGN